MSYGYSDQPANPPYGNPSPYGQAGNPYDEESAYHGGGNPYSSGQYDARPQQGGYEMSNMNGNDPNRILNECRQVDSETDSLEKRQERLKQLQRAYIDDTSGNLQGSRAAEAEADSIRAQYHLLVQQMKKIKSDKESGNPRNSSQVGRVDRKVKSSLQKFMQVQRDYEASLKERIRRDYLIVRPDASEAELREAEESSDAQVFSQALMNSDRRGQAQNVAQSVRSRHEAIQKIEKDMQTIAAMFQDLDALVVQQEAQVTRIEETGQVVLDNANEANTHLDGAVKKARSARKKKWICLGIAVLIVIIIVVVVVVAVEVTKGH